MIFEKFRFLKKPRYSDAFYCKEKDPMDRITSYTIFEKNTVVVPKNIYRECCDDGVVANHYYVIVNREQAISFTRSKYSGIWEGSYFTTRKRSLNPDNIVPVNDAVLCWWVKPDSMRSNVSAHLAVVKEGEIKLPGVLLFHEESSLLDFMLEDPHDSKYIEHLFSMHYNRDSGAMYGMSPDAPYIPSVTLTADSVKIWFPESITELGKYEFVW